ncbi:LCP family protein [Cellulomonas alba]|uniref:LCP family protein n=1 Tax=Cellulomonas alba TaxID=3053467 RepID=A0ABT7SFG7_9CELL|nr:LCP family protein [Cellulomonas alba]MDM7854779.1 LCP family protein [Cellulomonas alba]
MTSARHARDLPRRHRALRTTALVATAVVVFTASAAAAVAQHLRSAVDVADTDQFLDGPRPTPLGTGGPHDGPPTDGFGGRAVNLLVIGTDSRDGENAELAGAVAGMRNDTTMVVHVAADRSRVDVVSIPRDSLVDIPSCKRHDGTRSPALARHQFNDAFSLGAGSDQNLASAAACVIRTVEQDTQVPIDASIVVKMDGVADVVGALGGLKICIPEHMESPKAGHLVLDKGWHRFDGRTAIQFLRARTGTGDGLELGSDLSRITRQQQFIDALSAQLRSEHLLAKPVELLHVLDAVARSLSVSRVLADPRTLAGLAYSLRDLGPSAVEHEMVPVVDAPARADAGRVLWTAAAEPLWARIRADRPLHATPRPAGSGGATSTGHATPPATAPAGKPATCG